MRNEVRRGELPNGIHFYSQYDWCGGTNLAGIGVKIGAIHAPPDCVGLPHLVEHLLARESLEYPLKKVDLIFEKFLGDPDGDVNIRIDRVSTHYGFGDLLKKKDMLICLDVMASFLRDKIITSEGIDVEKSAVHNEYRLRGTDVIPSLLYDSIHGLAYKRNPARLRIDGEIDDLLKRMGRSRITRFIQRHYVSENTFLIVLGPRFEEVRDLAKRHLGDWRQQSPPQLDYDHSDDLPMLSSVKSCEIVRDIKQYHLGLGFPTEGYMSEDIEVLEVLARILAYRLRHRLREGNRAFDGGVYRVEVEISKSFVHGLVYANFATVSGEFAKRGESIILEELQKFKGEFVSQEELDVMVYHSDRVYLEAFRKIPENLAEMIIEAVCNGDEDLSHLHTYRNRLHRVSRRRIREVANKYLSPNYIRVVIGPSTLFSS